MAARTAGIDTNEEITSQAPCVYVYNLLVNDAPLTLHEISTVIQT